MVEARGVVVMQPVSLFRWILILLLVAPCTLAQNQVSGSERLALRNLRASLGVRSSEWPRKVNPCDVWKGITCRNGHVVGINISGLRRTRSGQLNPKFSVDSLANFTFLESFNASRFPLPGSIPEWFGSSLGSLQVLDLRSCSVSGFVPSSLGNLTRLITLYLSDNDLAGSIPDMFGELKQLTILDASNNIFTGPVPTSLAMLGNLSRLDLSSNYLSGPIPSELRSLSRLQHMNLSDNGLSGSIPTELSHLSQLVDLDLSKNLLSGPFPANLRSLKNLQQLVIAGNVLEGQLPGSLFSDLSKLQVVVLSGNKLNGTVPSASRSPSNLRVVDVSQNNFTGDLPTFSSTQNGPGAALNLSNNAFYGTLTSMLGNFSLIDVSGNYMQGKVPVSTSSNIIPNQNCLQDVPDQRTSADCQSFYAERGLTFEGSGSKEESEPSKKSKRWIYILAGVFGGIGFVAMLAFVIVLVIRSCDMSFANQRGSSNVGPVPEGDSPILVKDPVVTPSLGRSFTYEQVIQFTGEFSESNLIKQGHSGDIFRGFHGGTSVAVKRVHARSGRKESYMMELELLSKQPHERLVPLLGHCIKNENEKFLVYKYMPNGDLANSLHRETNLEDDGLQSLDWITRLKIATGAAEGLSYLHRCSPPLVHRDVQASSILLDDKFEVRLGSLSEIHVQEGDAHPHVFTKFKRKPQSSDSGPSERALSPSCAYDVYCFGKVLLELVTGELGISSSDDATTREWLEQTMACIDMYDKEVVTKIVDPSLMIDEDLLDEVWAMAIVARSCLNSKPAKRPPMKYVLKALENPLKIVREESHSSGKLRTTSSRRSWSAAFFGSLRHSSSEYATVAGHNHRDGVSSSSKQPVRMGSHGSRGIEQSSSHITSKENPEEGV